MSLFRPALRNARLTRATLIRPLSTSRPARDKQKHQEDESTKYDTHESYFTPFWRNTLIGTALFAIGVAYLPPGPKIGASPTLNPAQLEIYRTDPNVFFLTRWIARAIPDARVWKEKNDEHLWLTKIAAEQRLALQDAERPKMRRLSVPRVETGSRHSIPVGSRVDMSADTEK